MRTPSGRGWSKHRAKEERGKQTQREFFKTMKTSISVSEHFASWQGEGQTIGRRAVFLRLKGCVLACTFCDTLEVWRKGRKYTFQELYSTFSDSGYFDTLNAGGHLVLTGGDPLIQQEAIVDFLSYCQEQGQQIGSWTIEVETEGVLMPSMKLAAHVSYWNVSPKLANSGMRPEKRIKPEVLRWHNTHSMSSKTVFKFPVALESDMSEVIALCVSLSIPSEKVFLMPVCATRADHIGLAPKVCEWAKKHNFNFSPRVQLLTWDLATGV